MRLVNLFLGLLLCVALATPVLATDAGQYTLGPGDKMRVTVFGEPHLSGKFLVNANGTIAMPLIEPIAVNGLTLNQTEAEIRKALSAGFMGNPRVSVDILEYRPFFIIGEVIEPGRYPYVADMTVLHAVAIAGGFTPRAAKNKIVMQRDGKEDLPVSNSTPVQPGDIITVKERFF
ncbi:polysaccharide biosynthesis/export family protein [Marichromatium bheemlicum]|uniref:Polysaccharide export protein n=1 Tax=Marichromatium bheemlicum TaxID=365339 RepID=A0ABX1IAJ2_9GAMM|nr:polysaccharide biosynthesis/export family protein [Marichromatium bheemlicum]NKN34550.1 polysaccharide export protein [Marichromatium bheemlicum]